MEKLKGERGKHTFAISNRLDSLIKEKGYNKKKFAEALGKRPNEITRWLSGEHNFTLSTIALLTTFFCKPLINVE